MATTQLFVELLIIGIGASIWLAILLAMLMGVPWPFRIFQINTAFLPAVLSFGYVVGIIIDRLAYGVFGRMERRHREQVLGSACDPSFGDRERFILCSCEAFRDQILYNRSRLRICRSWTLNFLLITLASGAYGLQQGNISLAVFSGSALVLTAVTAYVANTLARDHCNNIKYSYAFLTRNVEPPPDDRRPPGEN